MCRAILAFFWGTVTLLFSGSHVKDQTPIFDLISLDEANEFPSCDTLSQCEITIDSFSKENEEQLIYPVIVYNPEPITPKDLSTAITFPDIIALPIAILGFKIYEKTTTSDSEITIHKQPAVYEELSISILASTTCELTALSDGPITDPTSIILYEPSDTLSSTMCEPIASSDGELSIPILSSTTCELTTPNNEPITVNVPTKSSSTILYEPSDTLSSIMHEPISILIPASTTCELTTPNDHDEPITVSKSSSTILYELTDTLSSVMCEPTASSNGELSILVFASTMCEPTIPNDVPVTVSTESSSVMLYAQNEHIPTLSSNLCEFIAPYDDLSIPTLLAATVTIYHEDVSIATIGLLTFNEPTFVSASILTFDAVSTPTVYLDLDLTPVSESIYKVMTYTPNFVPGGSCPNNNLPAPAMPEVGWSHYFVSKIYISSEALWFFLFLAWCVCIKAVLRQHKLFCKEKDSRHALDAKFHELNLQSEYRTRTAKRFIRKKECEIEIVKKQSIEKDNLLEQKNALVEKYSQSHKRMEEKCNARVKQLEQDLEMVKSSLFEQERNFMQLKEEQTIEKIEIENALEEKYTKKVANLEKDLELSEMEQENRFMKLKEDLIKEQAIEKTEIQNALEKKVAKLEKELGLSQMYQLEQESRFIKLKEDLVNQQSIEIEEIRNALEEKSFQMCKETEEKYMDKATKSEQDLLEQDKKYKQLKKEFDKERVLRKCVERDALEASFKRVDEDIKRKKEAEEAKKNSSGYSLLEIQKKISRVQSKLNANRKIISIQPYIVDPDLYKHSSPETCNLINKFKQRFDDLATQLSVPSTKQLTTAPKSSAVNGDQGHLGVTCLSVFNSPHLAHLFGEEVASVHPMEIRRQKTLPGVSPLVKSIRAPV